MPPTAALGRYGFAGVSVMLVPGALLPSPIGAMEPPAPMRAPPRTQRAIRLFSAGVRIRRDWPRYWGESRPGIHGGILPRWVMARMARAYAAADRALVSENGAIPPVV